MGEINYNELTKQLDEFCKEDKENSALVIIADKRGHYFHMMGEEIYIATSLALAMKKSDGLSGITEGALDAYKNVLS